MQGVTGCIVYYSHYADPSGGLVADCSVGGRVGDVSLQQVARRIADIIGEAAGLTLGDPVPLAVERLGSFTLYKYGLGNGEARIVAYRGNILFNAAAVLPGEHAVEEKIVVGEVLEPPLYYASRLDPTPQKLIPQPVDYAAEGRPKEAPHSLTVRAGGWVKEVSVESLLEEASWANTEFHCVTGWSIRPRRWLVVSLRLLLEKLGAPLRGRGWLVAVSSGGYASTIPLSEAEEAYIALGLEGERLTTASGGPMRLMAPRLYGWKHTKWLTEIHLLEGYVDGYWEARGYHERGLVELTEKFKLRNHQLADTRGTSQAR